jgi:hypothetical protein
MKCILIIRISNTAVVEWNAYKFRAESEVLWLIFQHFRVNHAIVKETLGGRVRAVVVSE